MAENLVLPATSDRSKVYLELIPQLKALVTGEDDDLANVANLVGALKQSFNFFWVGVYRVVGNELVLGPFQGPIACTRIAYGKGVCGAAWAEKRTFLVPDVDTFPGHIACSSATRSEIVVPIKNATGEITMVLDIDSDQLDDFSTTDQKHLETIAALLGKFSL